MNYDKIAGDLAKRCEQLGWPVTDTNTGYRVKVPTGRPVIIHKTPRGDGYYKTIEKKLREQGFFLLEERKGEELRRAAAQRNAAEREKAAAAARRLAEQQRTLVRATYAGLNFTDDVDWALHPHETMQNPRVMVIDKAMADAMLEHNTKNRQESGSQIDRHVKILEKGEQELTHQGIAFSTIVLPTGEKVVVLQDGQTRLAAISKTGISGVYWVFVGMPAHLFPKIDTHRVRTIAHAAYVRGHRKYLGERGAMCRLIMAYQDGRIFQTSKMSLDPADVTKWDEEHEDAVSEHVAFGAKWGGPKASGIAASALGAGLWLITEAHADKGMQDKLPMIREWFDQLGSGAMLPLNDVRQRLRSYITNNRQSERIDNRAQLALIIITWEKWLRDDRAKNLKWAKNMKFPKITLAG